MKCTQQGFELTPFGPGLNDRAPAWQPFLGNRVMVGSGGAFFAEAAGFLVGEMGDKVTSFLAFTCNNDFSGNITPQSPSGDVTNAVFQIETDITRLRFVNDIAGSPVIAIPGAGFTTATGALVGFNTATGLVSMVVPYNQAPSPAKRLAKDGVTAEYTGHFPVVLDGSGKNLAPNGATLVTVNLHTGKVLGWRP